MLQLPVAVSLCALTMVMWRGVSCILQIVTLGEDICCQFQVEVARSIPLITILLRCSLLSTHKHTARPSGGSHNQKMMNKPENLNFDCLRIITNNSFLHMFTLCINISVFNLITFISFCSFLIHMLCFNFCHLGH